MTIRDPSIRDVSLDQRWKVRRSLPDPTFAHYTPGELALVRLNQLVAVGRDALLSSRVERWVTRTTAPLRPCAETVCSRRGQTVRCVRIRSTLRLPCRCT